MKVAFIWCGISYPKYGEHKKAINNIFGILIIKRVYFKNQISGSTAIEISMHILTRGTSQTNFGVRIGVIYNPNLYVTEDSSTQPTVANSALTFYIQFAFITVVP